MVAIDGGQFSINDLLVHDETDSTLAVILGNMIHNPELPRPMGVFHATNRFTYEEAMQDQIAKAKSKKGEGNLQKLLDGDEVWTVQ